MVAFTSNNSGWWCDSILGPHIVYTDMLLLEYWLHVRCFAAVCVWKHARIDVCVCHLVCVVSCWICVVCGGHRRVNWHERVGSLFRMALRKMMEMIWMMILYPTGTWVSHLFLYVIGFGSTFLHCRNDLIAVFAVMTLMTYSAGMLRYSYW